jgi:shikimate kinase
VSGKASAVAHGAATIVNAIALGKGAAFGVDLWTKSEVELTSEAGIFEAEIASDPNESPLLVQKTAQKVIAHFGLQQQFGAKIKTASNIPIARGLKSSSAAANATALATVAALDKKLSDLEIIKLGIDAAFEAKVTVTGAFDDACASYFGDVVVTDNKNCLLLSQTALPTGLVVLFHVPPQKAYTINSDMARLQTLKPLVEVAFEQATAGKIWQALTLNGLIYSAASNFNSAVAVDALAAGAVAAGLCGKGPATTAVTPQDRVDAVKAALEKHGGDVIVAHPNSEKAKVQ